MVIYKGYLLQRTLLGHISMEVLDVLCHEP
jgi:hypothetical protein